VDIRATMSMIQTVEGDWAKNGGEYQAEDTGPDGT
jgi:hypothetical protein